MSSVTIELPPLKIALGADGIFDAGVPVLAGDAVEDLFGGARPAGSLGPLALFTSGDWLLGAASVPLARGLEEAAHRLYENIFAATRDRHLARIWNYVPAINEPGPTGLENYRAFCSGRSLAFEECFGHGFNARLPSASAVGSPPGSLTVVFAASRLRPRHVENPLQVAAYAYPGAYGPRAPSFARATVVPGPAGATVFISGTAAIRGHATIAPQNPRQQLECTLENLGAISRACGLGPELDGGGASRRHFKVYVRHAVDLSAVVARLEEGFLADTDRISYLRADICRASLLLEIEATLFGVKALA